MSDDAIHGPGGWGFLDRIILEAPTYLKPQGRLVLTVFGFLGAQKALQMLQVAGLESRILAREEHPFPRIARGRLGHIRTRNTEGILPAGRPATCPRLVLCDRNG